MAKDSSIEWTHHTFNPWWGCDRVSPGCKHCYAEQWAKRVGQKLWGKDAPRRELSETYWKQPVAWNREAERQRKRKRVFCASMADVFEDRRDLDPKRERVWRLIAETPWLDWLLLTKRPQNVARLAPYGNNWPANVWLGSTAENQRWFDKRMAYLTVVPARVLFLSCEPLLSALDLSQWIARAQRGEGRMVDWIIAGGESGPRARPMHPEWATSLRDQCVDAGVRFHFKQWGNWQPVEQAEASEHRSRVMSLSDGRKINIANVGKKAAGRRLQGRTWDELPTLS